MTVSRHFAPIVVACAIVGGCFLILRFAVPARINGDPSVPQSSDQSKTDGIEWFQSKDGKYGLRNGRGDVVLEPTYDGARPFSDGLAAVNIGGTRLQIGSRGEKMTYTWGGKWGYANSLGKLVIPVQYENPGRFRAGIAPVYTFTFDAERRPTCHHRTRFIDRNGKTLFTVDGNAEQFHEGLAVVRVAGGEAESNEHESYGFIDRHGRFVIRAKYGEARSFKEGLAAVRTKKTTVYGAGDSWGFIDKTGHFVIKPEFNQVGDFKNGVAHAHVGGKLHTRILGAPPYWEGGQWWLIDMAGNKLNKLKE